MADVFRQGNESIESMLKRFRKRVQQERILTVTKRRRFYEKPSQKRKRKAARKLRKSRRVTAKMNRYRH